MNKPLPFFYLLLLFLLSPLLSQAQKQGSIWYFGMGAGINFNTSPPSALTDGQSRSDEGVATLCDSTGQLLFYTDGTLVWDTRQKIMQNGSGLRGGSSSTQAAIIVPHPGKKGQFYIFTTNLAHGLCYSEVNMALNEGRGAVVPATKNTLLIPTKESTEKLTATRNSNGRDYWVITHTLDDNAYHVFPVTAAGIGKGLIFPVGAVIHRRTGESTSYLKLSPDGNLLADARGNPSYSVELLHFNKGDGSITGPVTTLTGLGYAYGLEFSPNGNLLYVANRHEDIYQFDLRASDINASRTDIVSRASMPVKMKMGALQLAPDGRIYLSSEDNDNRGLGYLGTINHPDKPGLACDYVPQSFYLGGKKTQLGLPNFVGSFFYHPEDFQVTGSCQGGATAFKISNTKNIDSVKWDFGDHAVSASINPAHTYRQPGTYRVRLIIFYPWAKDTAFKEITIHGAYKRTTIARICTGQTWLLPDGRRVGKTGVYTAAFRDRYGCDSVITTRLIAGVPYHHAVQDSICPHQPYHLPDGRTVDSAGTYLSSFLTVNGCDSTITTRLSYRHPLYLRAEESICAGTAFRLPNGRAIDREGTFRVKLPSATGCDTVVTYRISMKHPPVVSLGADTCLVPGQRLTLNAGKGYAHYQWQDGSMLPQKEVTFAGTYAVIVSNSCGIGLDSIRVSMDCTAGCRFPTAFTPNGDGVNDVFRILNIHGQKLLDFCVYDRWGKRVFYTKDIFRGWDGTSRGRPAGTGPYIYFAEIVDLDGNRQVYKGTVLLIR